MAIELPASVIYAYPQGGTPYSIGAGNVIDPSSDPLMDHMILGQIIFENASAVLFNGDALWRAAGAWRADGSGNSLKVMEECFKGLSGKTKTEVERQFRYHCEGALAFHTPYAGITAAHRYLYVGVGSVGGAAKVTQNVYGNHIAFGYFPPLAAPYRANPIDFYGNVLMPLTAIGYWLFGGGIDRNVRIESLGLKMAATDFKPLTAVLSDVSKGAGTYKVEEPFSYNIFDQSPINLPAAGTLGRVSGNLKGNLVVGADSSYTFSGVFTLNRDLYDAGGSNRTPTQEGLTTFLRGLGDVFGHTDYYINILGEQKVSFSGKR